MYANKNYEWMSDWTAPRDKNFVLSAFAYLYWMYMFNKLRMQGTQKDRLRLAELYDEAIENEVSCGGSIFSKNTSFYYRNAVTTFIYETRRAAINDDIAKERMIEAEDRKRQIRENNIAIYGYDPEEKKASEALYEIELDEAGKNNPERNKMIPCAQNPILAEYPPLSKVCEQKIVHEITETVETFTRGNINVHVRIYDKVNTYYTAIIWADSRPLDANGKQTCVIKRARRYAGLGGIVDKAENELMLEKARVGFNNFDSFDKKASAKKAKKKREVSEDDIDISNVTAALGMDGNDDLNGDIF